MQLPIASNYNILIADKRGKMVVVECTPNIKKIGEAKSVDDGYLVCTVNSFISDKLKPYDFAKGDDYHSYTRYSVVMDNCINNVKNNDPVVETQKLLKGEYGFMCQYDDEPDFETIWSSIFDLSNLMIYRAEGDPRKLMAGFWDTTKGKVIFGGKNIKEIPFAQLMDEVSYVAQDNFLFDESIRENIRIGKPSATDDEVVAAAKAACCHDFIVKLENGYDTNAGDAGGKLSGGERQRITIARAILKNARVIILDEATAYADPENEYLIQSAISKLVKGKTLIVVAHRLATIQNADQILVVENGKIVGCGGQEELLLKCPLYQRLWSDYVSSADQVEGGKV